MLFESFEIPPFLKDGIKPTKRGSTVRYIYGADTETIHGLPLTLQLYSEDAGFDDIAFVTEKNALKKWLSWCAAMKSHAEHVIYIHNLDFDLPELFFGEHARFITPDGDFEFTVGDWEISGVYGSPTFCTMFDGSRRIKIIDSFSFFRGSLLKAAKLFCPDLPKLKRPAGLGDKRFTPRDTGFVRYAMRDAVVSYHIGKALDALHLEFDLPQCVSIADFASRVFRRHFLDYTIPQPPRAVQLASLLSYHGGKNNVAGKAGWHEGVSSLDISSAYPHAMSEFPAFSDARLYREISFHRRPKRVPEFGVYCVTGRTSDCKWPVLFEHDFSPLRGEVNQTWINGYELNEALRSGELRPGKIHGFVYDADRDKQRPALNRFVSEFYRRKESEKDKVTRTMYKLILNSISGKFIQTRKSSRIATFNIATEKASTSAELIAGGMCHPFIASAITAHTRARIHDLEHDYKAIHTATDGIFTSHLPKKETAGLGGLTHEQSGDLLMVRNKLYVLYGDAPVNENDPFPSKAFRGKFINKYALHGFQSGVLDLEKLVATGRRKYKAMRVNRLRDSLKRGVQFNDFVERDYCLKVGPLTVQRRLR